MKGPADMPVPVRTPETALRRPLSVVFMLGYRGSLLLIAAGVLLRLFGVTGLGAIAEAGVILLLVTPAAAALVVGVLALRRHDKRLFWTVVGIYLLLGLGAWLAIAKNL